MSQTESVGAIKNVTVGGNFMTNVVGSLMEFVKGNRESKAKEVKEQAKARQIVSEGNNDIHSKRLLIITVEKTLNIINYVYYKNNRR